MNDISVIIVNYNTAEEIVDCINSILIQQGVSVEILVWDNGSQDNSLEVLQRFTDKIQFVANKGNLGFAKASNLLVKKATSPYIFLLNPDAYLQDCNTLLKFLNFMRENTQYGIVGARLINETATSEDPVYYHYPGEELVGKRFNALPGDIAWMTGTGIMLPREVFVKVGGYDERFFLYVEDIDLCFQVRKAGYKIAHLKDIDIIHHRGASQKSIDIDKRVNPIPSKILFYEKYYTRQERIQLLQRLLRMAGQCRILVCWLRWFLRRKAGDRQAYAERKLMRKCIKEALQQLSSSVSATSTIT